VEAIYSGNNHIKGLKGSPYLLQYFNLKSIFMQTTFLICNYSWVYICRCII